MYKKLMVMAAVVAITLMTCAARADNFTEAHKILLKFKYTHGPNDINGFQVYKKTGFLVGIRPINGWVAEGWVVATGDAPIQELALMTEFIYYALQDSRSQSDNDAEVIVNKGSSFATRRTKVLIDSIIADLSRNKKTEFTFDGLNVRGLDCGKVSLFKNTVTPTEKKSQAILIKLWIP